MRSLVGFALTDVIHCQTLGIPGMDRVGVYRPGQYLTKLALNVAGELW